MSLQAALANSDPKVAQLVLAATREGQVLVGEGDNLKKEVEEWISKINNGKLVEEANLKELDSLLVPKTYLAGSVLTAADVALYGALHPIYSKFSPAQYYALPSVTRYFNHIQSNASVRSASGDDFPELHFDLENAPKVERTTEPPKRKEKAPAAEKTATPPAESKADATPAPEKSEKPQKKEKKEKKKEAAPEAGSTKDAGNKKGGNKAPAAADDGEPVPSMIDLRVGHIVDVIKHPDADGLYVEQIDLGEETGPRTVVSGLVNYIPIEQMRDKYLVAVCNLKPANMRGVKSFAMVLCATSKDGKEGGIELIQPPAGSKPGDRVYFEGEEYENATPLPQLNPKKKIFEAIQPGFITLDSKEAAWVNPTTNQLSSMIIRSPAVQSIRSFSTTARVCKTISIIGREPIKIPPSVQITTSPTNVTVSGPLGLTSIPLKPYMKLEMSPQSTLSVSVETPKEKEQRQMWGTTRTLISNAVIGMTEGFSVPLYLVGVGYKAALENDPRGTSGGGSGQRLFLKLGHSHPIYVPVPPHIKVEVPTPTKIVLSCTDKQLLGLFAAKIREFRKPEPYKGKGVFIGNETIRIKSVKKK
ncbi:hypothetical protein CVT24_007965 [Panaeolus cyanescens]|uniref:tRNA-binding domain-containing protein n=1 Tax=Panaeolus cyanescens TaxID=181874 RepID=A0A409YQR7_9AGAR|nr:hypothetical protein CVT24_007965 [Panaeolus cyanescens]